MSDDWIEVDGELYARVAGANYQNMTEMARIATALVARLGSDRTLEQQVRNLDGVLPRFFVIAREMQLIGEIDAAQAAGEPLTKHQKMMMHFYGEMAKQRRKEAALMARYGVEL